MPGPYSGILFGISIESATYVKVTKAITIAGDSFGDYQYGVSAAAVSLDGSTWIPISINSYSDDQIVGTFADELEPGSYRVRVKSSDNVETIRLGVFSVASPSTGGGRFAFSFGFSMGF